MLCLNCGCVLIISFYRGRFCLRSAGFSSLYRECRYIADRYIGVLSHTLYSNFCRDIEYSSLSGNIVISRFVISGFHCKWLLLCQKVKMSNSFLFQPGLPEKCLCQQGLTCAPVRKSTVVFTCQEIPTNPSDYEYDEDWCECYGCSTWMCSVMKRRRKVFQQGFTVSRGFLETLG